MNIVFMGTPDFAVPSLKGLIENFDVKAVFTQPDRPKGRGNKITMSPVKMVALENNIPVYQPKNLKKEREYIDKLREIQPDFIIVVAFGQILSKEVLEIPKYACINLHASLLPKYRGAAPINFAIINGETKSGNTSMIMGEGLDTGDMLLKQEVEIGKDMTAGELHDILSGKGSSLLIETINNFSNIKREKQEDSLSCYASMINKDMAKINWSEKAENINNLIRGLNPWPIAFTEYEDKVMKIYKAQVINKKASEVPGCILKVTEEGIEVACGENTLLIEKVQFPGKKPILVKEYIRGNQIKEGNILK
ncbi:methionyl-tRNA formyltransferase [Haloimpatiens lingqiaonensis]|uniref:methionyl-tRNA formyltransferase n=1 Tax=Haloimpatiens lingqiaonensis TaxID=1380675 RepID=UPI0010FD265C|nr:methionyl-tRNA formyltransferase [Haloimpatiens lingqiaonensis]